MIETYSFCLKMDIFPREYRINLPDLLTITLDRNFLEKIYHDVKHHAWKQVSQPISGIHYYQQKDDTLELKTWTEKVSSEQISFCDLGFYFCAHLDLDSNIGLGFNYQSPQISVEVMEIMLYTSFRDLALYINHPDINVKNYISKRLSEGI